MGTKNNPGEYDCYANADPDEPMFVLLGRDERAPGLVSAWVAVSRGSPWLLFLSFGELTIIAIHRRLTGRLTAPAKAIEAIGCVFKMRDWRRNRG